MCELGENRTSRGARTEALKYLQEVVRVECGWVECG